MARTLTIAALLTPVIQTGLMSLIGYPLAIVRRTGMDAFRRSGFAWWLITLSGLVGLTLVASPNMLRAWLPRSSPVDPVIAVVATIIGLAACCAVELFGSQRVQRPTTETTVTSGSERYEQALPTWATSLPGEVVLLLGLAVLEEAAYRGIALGGLRTEFSVGALVALVLTSVMFGLAHWYYGLHQIIQKSVLGVLFGLVAFGAGWVGSACVHGLLNVTLVAISRSRRANKHGDLFT